MDDIQERRKSLSSNTSPPVQQFATFKTAEPYQHIPTPALEPADQLSSLSGPSARGGSSAPIRPGAKRDRSVDIFEKHTLTKPRVDETKDGQPFSFKTGAAAEFEKPVIEPPVVQIMQLPLGRRRSLKSATSLMSDGDMVRAEAKMKEEVVGKERSRESGEARRGLMGNVKSCSSPLPSPTGEGIWGLAERARERSRSSSRNHWEQEGGMEGKQKRRSLTVMTGSVEEEVEENPRTGRLGSRF